MREKDTEAERGNDITSHSDTWTECAGDGHQLGLSITGKYLIQITLYEYLSLLLLYNSYLIFCYKPVQLYKVPPLPLFPRRFNWIKQPPARAELSTINNI